MRLAIVSDTHFGDPACGLASGGNLDDDRFSRFFHAATQGLGPVDFLIMAGDIFDFAIVSYEEAFKNAKAFFQEVHHKKLARQVIYIPGNHDGDFAHLVDYEVNVIKKIRKCKNPRELNRSMPGVMDDRPQSPGALFWPAQDMRFEEEIQRVQEKTNTGEMRDGIFLDRLFYQHCPHDQHDPTMPKVWVCYPNLYLITRQGECVLITHGHYFETYWALGGQVGLDLVGDDLDAKKYFDKTNGSYLSQADNAGMNFPLSQLSCTGIGQASPLTKVARQVQKDIKMQNPKKLDTYLSRLPASLIKRFDLGWGMGFALKTLVAAARPFVRHAVENYQDSRGNAQFLNDDLNQKRVGCYYLSCLKEINAINQNDKFYGPDQAKPIPHPVRMIWGHTHERTGWKGGKGLPFPKPIAGKILATHNCGGWLLKEVDGKKVTTAEVFTYSSEAGFGSVAID